jgi:two-component system, cell cycle sensor histidine kinase and response regulator CckA
MTSHKGIVLVVDDEDAIRELAVHFLAKSGFQAMPAGSAAEALELFRRSPGEFSLLVTDMVMPDLFGDQLANQMRELRPELPILFMSGNIPEALEPGIELEEGRNFIQKPFRMPELVAAVERCLDECFDKDEKEN